ncbi:MAG: hypothetical protein E6G40_11845 [Actinobacteria bacterium]|nr:MAG: hypothetical protein E6G40_11845 [Actinomycetota bacterium]
MVRKLAFLLVVLAMLEVVGAALAQPLDPLATDIQGSIALRNPNPPTSNKECSGGHWNELSNELYEGPTAANHPRFDGATLRIRLYIAGGAGSGVALGSVKVFDELGLIAKGRLTAATNGLVPPGTSAETGGLMDLALYANGQPTGERAILQVHMTVNADSIAGDLNGGGIGKSVVWNGEKCP